MLKKQCEDMKSSLALPYGAGASVRARLDKSLNELDEEITYLKRLSDSLNQVATLYEETEKRIIDHSEQKVKKSKREEKESLSDVAEDEPVYDADAVLDAFMDTWVGDVLTLVMMSTSRSDLISKTVSDLGRGMTLAESLIDTEEETKGMIQALPKYAIDTVEGALALVDVIVDTASSTKTRNDYVLEMSTYLGREAFQLWQKIEKDGFDNTVKEIVGAAWQGAATKYEDAFVNVSVRERGENEMRAAIAIVEAITAVKALKSLTMSGKAVNKLDAAARVLDSIDDDVAKHADDILPDGDEAAKACEGKGSIETIWTGKDKYVPELANAIEQRYPGRIQAVEKVINDENNRPITDLDIELDNIVIQVKSGSAKGLTSQMLNTAKATGKTVISYTPDISESSAVLRGVRKNGFETFTNMEDLLEYLSNH